MHSLFLTEKEYLDRELEELFEKNRSPENIGKFVNKYFKNLINHIYETDKNVFGSNNVQYKELNQKIDEKVNTFYVYYEKILEDTKMDLKRKCEEILKLYSSQFKTDLKSAVDSCFYILDAMAE